MPHHFFRLSLSANIVQQSARIRQVPVKNQLVNDCIYAPSSHTPARGYKGIPDRQDPKWGSGGEWPLAAFNLITVKLGGDACCL